MRPNTVKNINAADASADATGAAIVVNQVAYASAQVVMTGTASGTLYIQYSNDQDKDCTVDSAGKLVPTNWSDISSSIKVVADGTAGVFAIPVFQCCYNFIRAHYVKNNASAGTVTCRITTQGY